MAAVHAQHGAMLVDDTDALNNTLADAPDGPVCVGFSGGLDSSVLLHLLAHRPGLPQRGLRACHVNHGLHPDADAWATHCQRICDGLGVPLTIATVAVDRAGHQGPEAAARAARHAAFAAELRPSEALALAHHREDQAETFLLRALRASGPDGLAAMRRTREFGPGVLWRPLLETPRAAMIDYARRHDLSWIDDPSNERTQFDRNFLRHRVLPLLRERWPHADQAFARSAALCADATGLLAAEDERTLAQVLQTDGQALSVPALNALPVVRRARVLRRWIDTLGLPPLPAAGVARIESDLLRARVDAQAQFAWDGAVVHCWRDQLHARMTRPSLPKDWSADWDGHAPLVLPGGDALALVGASGFDAVLQVHARRGGERIVLPGRAHSHALKHVLQEREVPPWRRERMPLLCDAGTVLAAGDAVYSASFDAWLRDRSARLAWACLS